MERLGVGCGGDPDEAVRAALVEGQAAIGVWLLRRLRGDAEAAAEVLAAFCLRALEAAPRLRDGAACQSAWKRDPGSASNRDPRLVC
jgi:hypothetical protein